MLLVVATAHAAALFGAAFTPPGIGTLAWDDANGWSDTLAGEFDGLLRPPLTAHGGWIGTKDAVLGSIALVRFRDSSFAETNSVTAVGSLRLALDYRRYLHRRDPGRVGFYADGGIYYIVPNATDVSDGYTPEEQASADEGSVALRGRVGGIGAQLGIGAEYLIADAAGAPAVSIGLRYVGRLHRGEIASDEGYEISTVVLSEAALILEFQR